MFVLVQLVDDVVGFLKAEWAISLLVRSGSSIISAGFFANSPSRIAAAKMVEGWVITLRFALAEAQRVSTMVRRSRLW